ncbi:MAG: hypothetical protein JW928_04980 [Candidatus Aureabacteria bacterium]|nr:hypothetical protein [Candidatus Auribacterota bacterium]
MNSERIILQYLREIHKYDTTAFLGYSTLKRNIRDEKVLQILSEIAEDEKKHIEILNELISKLKERIPEEN